MLFRSGWRGFAISAISSASRSSMTCATSMCSVCRSITTAPLAQIACWYPLTPERENASTLRAGRATIPAHFVRSVEALDRLRARVLVGDGLLLALGLELDQVVADLYSIGFAHAGAAIDLRTVDLDPVVATEILDRDRTVGSKNSSVLPRHIPLGQADGVALFATDGDLVLFLISGGASALLTQPLISLDEWQRRDWVWGWGRIDSHSQIGLMIMFFFWF